jgi:hypothetical protein
VANLANQGAAIDRVIDGFESLAESLQVQLKECREAYARLRSITHTQWGEDKT